MKGFISILASGLLAGSALAAPTSAPEVGALEPTKVTKRADVCGQWDSITTGSYIMYQDLWGEASATSGSQCSGVDSLSGTTIKWHTSWTWAGGPSNVKSFAQIMDNQSTAKQLSAISTYKTTWSWTYTGSNIVADVAYDMFTCSDATSGCTDFEVMIWLAAMGGAFPISSTGSPIATVSIGGFSWKLYKGLNGSMTVFSFVASSTINNFSGDLKQFFTYLINSQGFPATQFLKGAAAGSEPFTGSNAQMISTYSAVRN